ncbi:MAG: epoxyqueuosine reductase QueH [Bacteroidales bacterium]|nr:epoxyqueuosine reductase QueH [Bacteroidales bacterium]
MKTTAQTSEAAREVPGGARRILLHACCAPCSSAIVEYLMQGGVEPVIFYSNPNIYPREEYEHRRDECARYARHWGVQMVEDRYDHAAWRQVVQGLEGEPERGRRCQACFRYRLGRAAAYAQEQGYPVLTTTLASSRWKRLDQIDEAGTEACAAEPDVCWWDRNWRKGGLQERRNEIIREQQFYNQRYCGCEFSMGKIQSDEQH